MKCSHCTPDAMIEHRELRCAEYLSKHELCPNALELVRKEVCCLFIRAHQRTWNTTISDVQK